MVCPEKSVDFCMNGIITMLMNAVELVFNMYDKVSASVKPTIMFSDHLHFLACYIDPLEFDKSTASVGDRLAS